MYFLNLLYYTAILVLSILNRRRKKYNTVLHRSASQRHPKFTKFTHLDSRCPFSRAGGGGLSTPASVGWIPGCGGGVDLDDTAVHDPYRLAQHPCSGGPLHGLIKIRILEVL